MINRLPWHFWLAMVAGALQVLSFAPFGFWPSGVVSLTLFYWLATKGSLARQGLMHYGFALGLFGCGVSWIYVSIHTYGGASPLLAGAMTLLFVLLWSLTFIPQGLLLGYVRNSDPLTRVPWFSITFVLGEWFRGWFLTGFPWLYVGYAHADTWIGSWAPIGGVLLVSFVVVLAAELLGRALIKPHKLHLICLLALVTTTALLNNARFVEPDGFLEVAGIQANLDQHTKWQPQQFDSNLSRHQGLMADLPPVDLVVWSEASFTRFADLAEDKLSALDEAMIAENQGLLVGLPSRDENGYFNGVRGLGLAKGDYQKRHLVPFGEYVPLAPLLRGSIAFFDLPMSYNQPGPWRQPAIEVGGRAISLSICYEISDAELVRQTLENPALLITISNDTWFGESIGPMQHLQIAQMRARELGRSLFRVTNNGVTAFISSKGMVQDQLPRYVAGVLVSRVPLFKGQTLYGQLGHWPIVLVLIGLLLGALALKVKKQRPG